MDKAIEKQIQQELDGFHLPRFRDIPDVGLLLEQTMRLVDSYLNPLDDMHLTSSMISNYVKHGIIARPVKKMYGREQIADLVIIAITKTVLPLDDIKRILEIKRSDYEADAIYDYFCEECERTIQKLGTHEEDRPPVHNDSAGLKEMFVLILTTTAHKIYLEKHIRAMLPQE